MNMEKEQWVETILNSTNGISQQVPDDALFSKIRQRIQQQNTVSPKTLWLVAASVAALLLLNFSVLNSKSEPRQDSTAAYLEMTVNQSNQLY